MTYVKALESEVFERGGSDETVRPPDWVVQRNRLPKEYRYATLHDSTRLHYNSKLFDTAREYFLHWPDIAEWGNWALFTGASGKGKTWAAAALVNEIQRVYGEARNVAVEWFPLAWKLPMLFDHYHFRNKDSYRDMYNRVYEADIVVFDDLLHVADYPRSKEFVFGVLDYRAQHQRASIITANAVITPSDWSDIEKVFNTPFVRRLRGKAKGYTAVV